MRFRSGFCSKITFSLEFLLKNRVFARVFAQKLRFRSSFCSKIAFSLEFLLKNRIFARGFLENCSKSASWKYFGRDSWPWAKIAQNRLLGTVWPTLLALCQNCSKPASWEHFGRGSWPWAKIAQNRPPGSSVAEVPSPGPKLLGIGFLGPLQ